MHDIIHRLGRIGLALVMASAGLAARAGATSGPWEWTVSGLAGVEQPLDVDGFFVDSNGPGIFSFFGIQSDTGFEFGGNVAAWRMRPSGLDWGWRGEYTHSSPDNNDNPVHILGNDAGETIDAVDSIGSAEVKLDRAIADVLVRWRSAGGDSHRGVNLFGGVGAGVEWLWQELGDGANDRDSSAVYRIVAGVEIGLGERFGVGGEYRYSKADHDLLFRTGLGTAAQRSHHLVGSFTYHLP